MASFSASLAASWRFRAYLAPLHPFSAPASVWRPRVCLTPYVRLAPRRSKELFVLFCFLLSKTLKGVPTQYPCTYYSASYRWYRYRKSG
jgi:hypothetical protein